MAMGDAEDYPEDEKSQEEIEAEPPSTQALAAGAGAPSDATGRAESVAAALAYEFFKEGRFSASTGPVMVSGLISATHATLQDTKVTAEGFGGVSIQAVGFEDGVADPVVHVYLRHGSLRQIKGLPKEIQGIPIVSHKMGAINVRPEAAGSATNQGHIFEKNKRVCCGSSCGPTSENSAGTLGALVRVGASKAIYLLSNNHVLAGCNHVPKGQPILAPANMDGRVNARAPGEIGRHDQIEELRTGHPGLVSPCISDLALALAVDENMISSWQGDDQLGFDTPSAVAEPTSRLRVKKFGRTTGLTSGVMQARITAPTPVDYNAKSFKGTVWFKDIWAIVCDPNETFALHGDSGSLVVSEDGKSAVGIVFAANPSGDYALMVPMSTVLKAFSGISLVSGHGV